MQSYLNKYRDTSWGHAIEIRYNQFLSWLFEEGTYHARYFFGIPLITVAIVLLGIFFFSSEKVNVITTGFQWSRQIDIERYTVLSEGSWYSHPSDAYNVRESYIFHYMRHDESCTTVGSGKNSRQVCTDTSYPVYDWYYDYNIDRWIYAYSLKNIGYSQANPLWPENVPVECPQIGCERQGRHTEIYTAYFVDQKKEKFECNYDQDYWGNLMIEGGYNLQVGKYTRWAKCDTLNRNS